MPLYRSDMIDSPQNVFNKARDIIRYFFGMKLSLIELVKLKGYASDAVRDISLIEHPCDSFNPDEEAVTRFFVHEYGIPPGYRPLFNTVGGIVDRPFTQHLQIMQESFHIP